MSAPSESAASPSQCACTNISLMQLFHELKQKFPGVPDHVVSNTIELYCHDKQACETHLHSEAKASLTHAYHASSSAAARQLNEPKLNLPGKCRNQPIVKHDIAKCTAVTSVTCPSPQTAVLSTAKLTKENEKLPNTDDNQNVVESKGDEPERKNNTSPVTVINIDNCFAKYNAESPSDLELSNDNNIKEDPINTVGEGVTEQSESTNYRILKSNKIRHNLHERLEKGKTKKTIKKEEAEKEVPQDKPIRPNTLNFIKPNPDIAFKPTLKDPEAEPCHSISPAVSQKHETPTNKEKTPIKPERGYPLNLSVNVNCHMDLTRGYDPWLEDYDSPRAITSVNLTVCTPTSNMASPIRESADDSGFEGHVTVTVSPSTTRPPRRPAPPPPPTRPSKLESPRPSRTAPEPPGTSHERSLIERQKERLGRLAAALAQEKARLAALHRETNILAAPPPPPQHAQRLRDHVSNLRDACSNLSKRLELITNEPVESGNFYSNIYTGQQPPSSWQCHLCTFRNHPLLDKCEECDMPRIFVGTSPVRLDSGFGSFRDRNRRITNSTTDVEELMTDITDCFQTLPKLNC